MHTRWVRPERQDRIHSSTAAFIFQATNASFLADGVKKKFPYNILTTSIDPDCLKSNAEDTHAWSTWYVE